jgi:CHAD domain-containing protein
MEEEIEGVRQNTDIEHVHWMRVASRRLRATLPLFAGCFKKKEYRRWMRSIKAVTRALGAARDTDVQIAFLVNYTSRQEPETGDLSGIVHLIATLTKQRQGNQVDVVAALDLLEHERTLENLASALRYVRKKRAGSTSPAHPRQLYHTAGDRIHTLLEDVLSYESSVKDPTDIAGHHALRIAVKKLRYTLEVYRPLYKNRLRSFLKSLKQMQEILGEIHDCDVWAGILAAGPELNLPPEQDLIMLSQDRKERRGLLYQELVSLWSDFKKKNIWEYLRNTVDAPT